MRCVELDLAADLAPTVMQFRPISLFHARYSFVRRLVGLATLVVAGHWVAPAMAAADESVAYGPGSVFESLTVGAVTYHGVKVKTVNARTVLFLHEGGMASAKLSELSPELQTGFGYDPAAAAASEAALQAAIKEREARRAAAQAAATRAKQTRSKFEQVLLNFGSPVTLREIVDLRPRFRELEFYAKDQGRRPSCSVFAVVSALEYIQAENTGAPLKFSEEYLIWATGRIIQRTGNAGRNETGDDADAGFALTEVVTALRSYGIPPASIMPNTMGRSIDAVEAPPPAVIARAREHTRVAVHLVPGRDNATQINNIVHALNAGIPVAIGTAWPKFNNMRAALLDTQTPVYGHAVTLVGYRSPSGRLEDATFIFKNSWGAAWGANGYGFVSYRYLVQHMNSAILLELSAGS
jgi:C1A family cysteine protease